MQDESDSQGVSVLVVEDDERAVRDLMPHLRAYGFLTRHEGRGDVAVNRIVAEQPDAVILDLTLPGKDGTEVCRNVRGAYSGPIIALTTRAGELDHILALECGADDFLCKPVDAPILLAHLKAALRRTTVGVAHARRGSLLRFGKLTIDLFSRAVMLGDRELRLTTGEFDLLWALASRAGEVVSRTELRATLRGIVDGAVDRSCDTLVSRLRKALEDDPQQPARIKTVHGKGYLFSPSG